MGVLTTEAVRAAFTEEILDLGGMVSECVLDGERLFGRSVLDAEIEVGPQDGVKGGVAIRCGEFGVRVQPYTFRLVCRNGAIFAMAAEAVEIEVPGYADCELVLYTVREAIRTCATDEAFRRCASAMEEARRVRAEPTVWLMALERMGHLSPVESRHVLSRFDKGRDPSNFGLLNAITSLARDTESPARRAELEELGGSLVIAAQSPMRHPGACEVDAGRDGVNTYSQGSGAESAVHAERGDAWQRKC